MYGKSNTMFPPPSFFEKLGDNNDFDNLMSLPLKKGDT